MMRNTITINGISYNFKDAALILKTKANTLVYRKRRGWTDDEIISGKRILKSKSRFFKDHMQIAEDRKNGLTLVELASKYNCDNGNMSRLCKRLGISMNLSFNKDLEDKILSLRNEGKSILEIAPLLKKSSSTIYYYLQKHGIKKLPNKKISEEEILERKKPNSTYRILHNTRLRNFRNKNKELLAERRKLRRQSDCLIAIKERVRAVTRSIFRRRKHFKKTTKTHELLGAEWSEIAAWIESKFQEGMSWNNMNKWHIDHKIPLSSAKTQEELESLCHYKNLQPLWAFDNMSKGAKILSD